MEPWAVFLDIDGTIYWKGTISDGVREAIAEAQERGHRFFINTGRSYAHVEPKLWDLVRWDGVVAGIGADVRVGGKTVFRKTVSMEILREIAVPFLQNGRSLMLEGEQGLFQIGATPRLEGEILERFEDLCRIEEQPISKITALGQLEPNERAALDRYFTVYQHENYAEAVLKGCNKATGMYEALRALNIPVEHSMAVGDSQNDWDMLDAAGIGVAMGNAAESTRTRYSVVAPSISKDGVAWAVRTLLP